MNYKWTFIDSKALKEIEALCIMRVQSKSYSFQTREEYHHFLTMSLTTILYSTTQPMMIVEMTQQLLLHEDSY